MQIEFTIDGKVKPKQSFRYTRFGHKYTPRDMKQYARDIQYSFYAKYPKWCQVCFLKYNSLGEYYGTFRKRRTKKLCGLL